MDKNLTLYDLKGATTERIRPQPGRLVPCPVCFHLVMAEQLNAAKDYHKHGSPFL